MSGINEWVQNLQLLIAMDGEFKSDLISDTASIYVKFCNKILQTKDMNSSKMDQKQLVIGRLINFIGFPQHLSFECRVIVNNTF